MVETSPPRPPPPSPPPLPPSSLDELRGVVDGHLLLPGQPQYEQRRQVHNGLCDNRPSVLFVPASERDVQEAVVGGLHLDLRELAGVHLHQSHLSSTGWAAVLGPGATWSKVLEEIDPEYWTLIHGQCLSVGVGGYLLGGGVNMA